MLLKREKNRFGVPRAAAQEDDRRSLGQLAKIIGAELPEELDPETVYTQVLTQCEYVKPGAVLIDAGWFRSERVIPEAIKRGAAAVFCTPENKKHYPQKQVIPMENPLLGVQRYESWKLEKLNLRCITITGSVGKTTTTGLIRTVMQENFRTFCGHSMANSHGAILRNVQRLTPEYDYWVQEVGGVQPGYVESSACVLRPDVAVLTNIGESHLNTYFTREGIFHDKSSLERCGGPEAVVVIDYDDEMLRGARYTHRVITCSRKSEEADYYARDVRITPEGTVFTLVCAEGAYPVRLQLYGAYNAVNALFAAAVGRHYGVPMEKIVHALGQYRPDGMRQNFMNIGGYHLMVDVFNAEPKTVLGSAQTLTDMVGQKGRKIFITGHIDKLGEESAQMHARLGHELAALAPRLDEIVFFAGDSRYTCQAMQEDGCRNVRFFSSRDELDEWMRQNIRREDLVFCKSGQFEAALAKSIDHVFGTCFQNEQQYNEGTLVEQDGFRIRLRQDNIGEIEGYSGEERELVLPQYCGETPILRIRPFAFSGSGITSVVIPEGIQYIGQEAFYQCKELTRVLLPQSLRYIGKNVFNYNRSLTEIDIPDQVIHIDRHAFFDCRQLLRIRVPDSVGFLGADVFGHSYGGPIHGRRFLVGSSAYVRAYLRENNPDAALSEQQTMSGEERERLRRALQQQLDGEVRIDAHALLERACAQAGGQLPAEESRRQCERWLRSLHAGIDEDGKLRLIIGK